MRKLITLLFVTASLYSHAQDTSKVEQYCEMIAAGRMFSVKVNIDVNYGEERSIWKDYRIKDDNGKLQKFNSIVDGLNYLGKNGWKLVLTYPVTVGGETSYYFLLKKEFDKSQTAEQ